MLSQCITFLIKDVPSIVRRLASGSALRHEGRGRERAPAPLRPGTATPGGKLYSSDGGGAPFAMNSSPIWANFQRAVRGALVLLVALLRAQRFARQPTRARCRAARRSAGLLIAPSSPSRGADREVARCTVNARAARHFAEGWWSRLRRATPHVLYSLSKGSPRPVGPAPPRQAQLDDGSEVFPDGAVKPRRTAPDARPASADVLGDQKRPIFRAGRASGSGASSTTRQAGHALTLHCRRLHALGMCRR